MENSPEKSFGFQYEHDGKSCMFDVIAATRQEAEARLSSMARAECVGEICEMPLPMPADHQSKSC
jgi:hypothetical protein